MFKIRGDWSKASIDNKDLLNTFLNDEPVDGPPSLTKGESKSRRVRHFFTQRLGSAEPPGERSERA
jgi:hypothetical protein